MQFTAVYDLPDNVVVALQQHWSTLARINLEDLAVIGYRIGILTSYQIQLMLHHPSRGETETFLKTHQCYLHYTVGDFQHDGEVLQNVIETTN